MLELFGNFDPSSIMRTLHDWAPTLGTAVAAVTATVMIGHLLGRRKGDQPSLAARAGSAIWHAFTTNWQLTLLSTTALVLSLASGWTTWDGMRNFTGEPVLSLMVTFGIQGVMLIIAWLIGESFAAGMGRPQSNKSVEWNFGAIVGALVFIGLSAMLLRSIGAFDGLMPGRSHSWMEFADKALYVGVGLLVIVALIANHRSAILHPYVDSMRVMAKNAILWVMFLACMATSVFFSFDSLFSAIFPKEERRRAADIRAARQVAGAVADIGALAGRRQGEESEQLFATKGWGAFEQNLTALAKASQGAEQDIEKFFVDKRESVNRSVATQQERIATARSGQAGLASRKGVLTDELSRLKGERPGLAADLAEKKTELDNRQKGLDGKRVEMMAEERGAEGTLKVGQGPVYRQRKGELQQLQDAAKIQEERVRDADKRLAVTDTRIAQIGRELAALDGDLAKLKGEAETAEQRIQITEQSRAGDDEGQKVDPARVRLSFERALAEFRQGPTAERLDRLAGQCSQLLNAMAATPATKERVRGIDCDPKQAAEAAGRVFALNSGVVKFAARCAGGDKLPINAGVDGMLNFGRQCLQESGLPSADSAEMAGKISSIDLNRDDKAHRFVVTWNAFVDGNRLAYLALAIAIAIDGLVFMSGLFGANAIRSPLTEIEDRGNLTADQLEATVDATLKEAAHPRATLTALLGAMHPINNVDGFTAEIILDPHEALVDEMRQVLVAGSIIGAVRRVGQDRSRFFVHSAFARYLAMSQRKPWKVKTEDVDRRELVNVIGVALLPDPKSNAEVVLSEMHPISDAQGFAAETQPFKIADEATKRMVINTLGAGATVAGAVRRNNDDGRYFVSTDFYKTLLLMRADVIPRFNTQAMAQRQSAQSIGYRPPTPLHAENVPRLEDQASTPRLPRKPEAVAGPAQSVPPVPPPIPGGQQRGPANDVRGAPSPIDANLGDEIRGDIIHLGGLHAWSDREIAVARAIGVDSEPEDALRRLSTRAPRLAGLVGQTIDENRSSLREAYEYLLANNGQDATYRQVLETVANELDDLMPLLMLTPGGPYQQILEHVLIAGLERQAGDGTLSPADDVLLARARGQVAALKGLSDNADDRYKRIVRIIDQYDERAPQPAPLHPVAKPDRRASG